MKFKLTCFTIFLIISIQAQPLRYQYLNAGIEVGRVEERQGKNGIISTYTYSVDSILLLEAHFKNDLETGIWKKYRPDGKLYYEATYKNGKLHGNFKSFHENGKVDLSIKYKRGDKNGKCLYFFESGILKSKSKYKLVPFFQFEFLVPKPSDYYLDSVFQKSSVRVGKEIVYYPDGKTRIIRYYDRKYIKEFDLLSTNVEGVKNPFFEIRDTETKTGKWLYFDDKGKVIRIEEYSNNKLIKKEDLSQ